MSSDISSEDGPSEVLDQCRKFHFVAGLATGIFGAILIRGLWVGDVFSVLIGLFAVTFPVWATRRQAIAYRNGGWI